MMYGVSGYTLGEPKVYGGYGMDATAEQELYKPKPKITDTYEVVSDRMVKRGSKMVFVPELGKIFASINTMARETGIEGSVISHALKRGKGRAWVHGYEVIEVVE